MLRSQNIIYQPNSLPHVCIVNFGRFEMLNILNIFFNWNSGAQPTKHTMENRLIIDSDDQNKRNSFSSLYRKLIGDQEDFSLKTIFFRYSGNLRSVFKKKSVM